MALRCVTSFADPVVKVDPAQPRDFIFRFATMIVEYGKMILEDEAAAHSSINSTGRSHWQPNLRPNSVEHSLTLNRWVRRRRSMDELMTKLSRIAPSFAIALRELKPPAAD